MRTTISMTARHVPQLAPREGPVDPAARLVRAFLDGRNPRTLRAYRSDLADFAGFMGGQDVHTAVVSLLASSAGDGNAIVLEYRNDLVRRGLAAATTNRRLSALRALVKLGRVLGLISWEIEIGGVKVQAYRDTRGPGLEGFRRMLAAVDGRDDAKAVRDAAVLRLLYDLGLRRGEVVAIDVGDVDLAAGCVAVIGKGRSAKTKLTMPPETQDALRKWIGLRGREPGPLFVNLDRGHAPRRLDGRSVARLVGDLGARVGIVARPHGLRHASVTAALEVTHGDLRAVARFSRHRDVRTVLIYDDERSDVAGEVARLVAARTRG